MNKKVKIVKISEVAEVGHKFDFCNCENAGKGIIIDCEDHYIVGMIYVNCVSIGAGFIREFKTLEEILLFEPSTCDGICKGWYYE